MTSNIAPENIKSCHNLAGKFRNYGPDDCLYRLWFSNDIDPKEKPNTILVHGAVIPSRNTLHKIDRPNNFLFLTKNFSTKLCSFLQNDCKQQNIWSFEYANEPVKDPFGKVLGYVNYGDLTTYGKELIGAIKK